MPRLYSHTGLITLIDSTLISDYTYIIADLHICRRLEQDKMCNMCITASHIANVYAWFLLLEASLNNMQLVS